VYGYFRCDADESESHIVIQNRTLFDNLPAIEATLTAIAEGRAETIDARGRPSAEWSQPWLTRYAAWKRAARLRRKTA
jgi:hypothetical protein